MIYWKIPPRSLISQKETAKKLDNNSPTLIFLGGV